jgi:hypothetical protein
MDAQDQGGLTGLIGRALHFGAPSRAASFVPGSAPQEESANAPSEPAGPRHPSSSESADAPPASAPPLPESHPAGADAAAAFPAAAKLTLSRLVAEWLEADRGSAARVVRLGWLADQWIAQQARHAVARPDAVRRIVERLREEGLRGELLRVNRVVALYWLAHLFGYKAAKGLPLSTLRAMLPLIKRQPRTGLWVVRAAKAAEAKALWARIVAQKPTAAAVRAEVSKLRPPRLAPPSRRKAARHLVLKRLADLNPDDLAYVVQCCQERLRTLAAQQRAA